MIKKVLNWVAAIGLRSRLRMEIINDFNQKYHFSEKILFGKTFD